MSELAILIIYTTCGAIVGYGLRRFGIPLLLKYYNLPITMQHWRYPFFEGVTVLCTATLGVRYAFLGYASLLILIFIWALLVLAFIDIEHFILPDIIIGFLWGLGLLVNRYGQLFTPFNIALGSSILIYIGLDILSKMYYRFMGVIGLGRGDIKLLGVFGAWFGYTAFPMILWIASLSGLIWALIGLYFKKYHYKSLIPFGPFLVGGASYYLCTLDLSTVVC